MNNTKINISGLFDLSYSLSTVVFTNAAGCKNTN